MDPQWEDSVPIYRQLRDRVVAMILDGILKEGDALPSVRSVASEFRLNPLTVLKGYQQLVDEHLVEKRRGRGMFVSTGAGAALLKDERHRFLEDEWPKVHATIARLGLSASELLVAIELPAAARNSSHFFGEFARRQGDYAIVGLAALAVVENDRLNDLRAVFFGVSDRPQPAKAAASLVKKAVTPASLSRALEALGEELDPPEDQQANGAMRRHLAKLLLVRCASKLLDRPELHAGGRP